MKRRDSGVANVGVEHGDGVERTTKGQIVEDGADAHACVGMDPPIEARIRAQGTPLEPVGDDDDAWMERLCLLPFIRCGLGHLHTVVGEDMGERLG